MQFSRSSRERTCWNFPTRSLSIFVIWPNYGTCAISCDSVSASFIAHSRGLPNSSTLRGAHRLQFSRPTASNIHHFVQLGYLCDFARSRVGQSFSAHAHVHKFPGPPTSASVGIFAHDHFFATSFGLIRVPIHFNERARVRKFPYPPRSAPD